MLIYSLISVSDMSESDVDFLRKNISPNFSMNSNMQRKESVSGKALLTYILKEKFGITDFFVECTESGKPYLSTAAVHFNISHCDDYVLCVCGDKAVGCDIEKIKPYNEKVARRFYTDSECKILTDSQNPDVDFMRMWTLKESALKYSGVGLSGGLDRWDFSEYYNREKFCFKGLDFTCWQQGDLIISICSVNNSGMEEFKTDVKKISALKGE